jgi:phage terminase Nu1 subunit (DNA packaging protein)
MQITLDDAAKIKAATVANIVKKIKSGKTPTAHETRILEESTTGAADFNLRNASCGVDDLAESFGVTKVRIQQLAKQQTIIKTAHGTYQFWESVKGYIAFLQARAAGRSGGSDEIDPDSYERHRARLYAARADAQEVIAARLKGTVHDADAVASVMNEMIANARSRLLAIPTAVAPKVADISDPNQCLDILTEGIHEALAELASAYPSEAVVAKQLDQPMTDAVIEEPEAGNETDAP